MTGDSQPQYEDSEIISAFAPSRTSDGRSSFWTNERLLKLVIFATFVNVLAIAATGIQQTAIQSQQKEIVADRAVGRENGYRNRAVACEILIVDNDRFFALDDICTDGNIIKYYPLLICELLGSPPACGTEFVRSRYQEVPLVESNEDE